MPPPRMVLVIDDDPDVREAIQVVLEDRGYRVICASDGETGIRRALDDRPDLVIVDMMMPRTSGFVVLDRLKHHHRLRTPIIMLTGNESDHQRQYAMFLGVDEYMTKPVQTDQLLRSIDHFLSLSPPGVTIAP